MNFLEAIKVAQDNLSLRPRMVLNIFSEKKLFQQRKFQEYQVDFHSDGDLYMCDTNNLSMEAVESSDWRVFYTPKTTIHEPVELFPKS